MEEPAVDDPYYDEWVQAQLAKQAELEEEQVQVDDEESQKDQEEFEKSFRVDPEVGGLVDLVLQDQILIQLAAQPTIEPYYGVTIVGGKYEDTLQLSDTTIPDNPRALRQLASEALHYSMVRSQYDREDNGE